MSERRRRVLITGASSGLGAEMARQFAARGHDLGLCARRVEKLEQLRDQIHAAHPGATVAVRALDVDAHDTVPGVFTAMAEELGGLDRVIVNAGLGKGAPIGTGRFDVNKETVTTNLVSALAQCEAAMEIFRAADDGRGAGHLVVISSVSAVRGMPRSMTAYAASKAGVAVLAEGIRSEMIGTPITVSTILPGYIASEMNDRSDGGRSPLMADTAGGVRAMVKAIEREASSAAVPAWPWVPLAAVLRHAPLSMVRKFV